MSHPAVIGWTSTITTSRACALRSVGGCVGKQILRILAQPDIGDRPDPLDARFDHLGAGGEFNLLFAHAGARRGKPRGRRLLGDRLGPGETRRRRVRDVRPGPVGPGRSDDDAWRKPCRYLRLLDDILVGVIGRRRQWRRHHLELLQGIEQRRPIGFIENHQVGPTSRRTAGSCPSTAG